MNEIEKLKTEHARYKQALTYLSTDDQMTPSFRRSVADAALNPPLPPPVTLDELKNALTLFQKDAGPFEYVSIRFYKDESGSIIDYNEKLIFPFTSFREAVDFLTNEN